MSTRSILFVITVAGLLASGVFPKDRFTWFLEILPILIGLPILIATKKTFPLTPLLYLLLFVHAVILIVGGHYTYAEVPFGEWMKMAFGFTRNNYDRLGHFAQGFIPAILVREFLLRRTPLQKSKTLVVLVLCVCLAISASYELFEAFVALVTGQAADAFLGSQGDVWDTQWDMCLALIGAATALALLSRLHDRQLGRFMHSPLLIDPNFR